MNRTIKWVSGVLLAVAAVIALVFIFEKDARNPAQITTPTKIGDVAVRQIASNPDSKESVAAEFINIPIEVRKIADGIWQATGIGNTHLITTSGGDVLFDTGLAAQVPQQINALKDAVGHNDVTHIILSHSHADHSGGTKFWQTDSTEIVAHAEFEEEQRYLTELQDYFWYRNRTLFPFIPEKPPKISLSAYGGIEPTIKVQNGEPYQFSQGDVDFKVYALPGAEGADNIVLWLPQQKILFSGDFFGPLFPQFPNVFTMRGEKIRKPVEYINSLETILALEPEMIVPSHKDPITDTGIINRGLRDMRDATRYVHDATVAGMNSGKTLHELMKEIELPHELALTQEHGKVSWAVKSIWEYYATWFHFDKTTELYHVPASSVASDIVSLAGVAGLVAKAKVYANAGEPLKALHLVDMVLAAGAGNKPVLEVRKAALTQLLETAKATHKNSYEIYWLNYRLRDTDARLSRD